MDRRQHQRIESGKQQRCTLRIQDLAFDAKPWNISAGGLFLKPGVLFPNGAQLEIELAHKRYSATCQALVQHRHNGGMGLAFVEPSDTFSKLVKIILNGWG